MTDQKHASRIGLTFVVPVYNEENAVVGTLERLKATLSTCGLLYEVIAVDDGSHDESQARARSVSDVKVIALPDNSGYGFALKTGIRAAKYDWIGIVDADGTYPIEELPKLIDKMRAGFDMVVARRTNVEEFDSRRKRLARRLFFWFLRFFVNKKIQDPNSGFRLFRRQLALNYMPFLSNRFSFTTSITLFSLGDVYHVAYVDLPFSEREGRSKVSHARDSLRTIQLMFQGITFFNPLKLYILLGVGYLLGVGIPALAMEFAAMPILAKYWLWIGTVVTFLIAIGALVDIVRISILRGTHISENDGSIGPS